MAGQNRVPDGAIATGNGHHADTVLAAEKDKELR